MDDDLYQNKCLLLDIGARGAKELKQEYPNSICIYLIPPTQQRLASQMIGRSPQRMERNKKQIEEAKQVCDFLVINHTVEQATEEIELMTRILQRYEKARGSLVTNDLDFLYGRSFYNTYNRRFLKDFYWEMTQRQTEKEERGR